MKNYFDLAGDGGSEVLDQVADQKARIDQNLSAVRHIVCIGSGKGGVGKSTLSMQIASALRARDMRVALLDADFGAPVQACLGRVPFDPELANQIHHIPEGAA